MKIHRPKKDEKRIQTFVETSANVISLEAANNQLKIISSSLAIQEQISPSKFTEIIAIFHQPTFYTSFSILMWLLFENTFGLFIFLPITLINGFIFSLGSLYYDWYQTYCDFIKLEDSWIALKEKLEENKQHSKE